MLVISACVSDGRVEHPAESTHELSQEITSAAAEPLLIDATKASGLDFVHVNGMTGQRYFSEMMGAGAALFDVDNDGDLDLFLVQGGPLGPERDAEALPVDRLYRNDLDPATGELRWTDITDASGLRSDGYGMGVTAADFDADGWLDIYVTNADRNRHFRNLGDGRFEDVTDAVTGIASWSVPAVPLDIDGDGDLDLFVGNYVDYSPAVDKPCVDELGQSNYCGPMSYRPLADHLLLNRGDGRFEDWTGRAGMSQERGACLGATAVDLDGDGRLEIYVANDGGANAWWVPDGEAGDSASGAAPRFVNRALLSGLALNADGHAEASMGVAVADIDGDGDEDLFLTHLDRETNTLYLNRGQGFVDQTAMSGLGAPSLESTGFGTGWLDVDNDGLLDLLVVNGAVKVIKEQALEGDPLPLKQADRLYLMTAPGRFKVADSATAGGDLERPRVSRGLALGDVDNDGDSDVVITTNGGPARLLLAARGQQRSWLGARLVDGRGVDALGASVTLELADGRQIVRRVGVAGSYASSSDPRVLFGLGDVEAESVRALRVRWLDGSGEMWLEPSVGVYRTYRQGTGSPIDSSSDSSS